MTDIKEYDGKKDILPLLKIGDDKYIICNSPVKNLNEWKLIAKSFKLSILRIENTDGSMDFIFIEKEAV